MMQLKSSSPLIKVALVAISAVMLNLSLPGLSFWPFAFIALLPLYLVFNRAESYKEIFLYAAVWRTVEVVIISYWIFHATMGHFQKGFFTSVFFYTITVLLPCIIVFIIFAALYRYLHKNTMFFYSFIVPSLWILTDYLFEALPFFIPWGFLGYSTHSLTNFRMAASIGGIHLLTFLVVSFNGTIFYLLNNLKDEKTGGILTNKSREKAADIFKQKKIYAPLILLLLIITVPSVYGIIRNNSIETSLRNKKAHQVKIVQGNFGLRERWAAENFINRMNTYISLSRKKLPDNELLIIWPETVLNSAKQVNKDLFKHIIKMLGREKTLISGGIRSGRQRTSYNSAFAINGYGTVSWYDKLILLPYSENVPAVDVLGKFYDAPASFIAGNIDPVLDTPQGRAGLSICFEALYGTHIRKAIDLGANYLVNISNDTWFGDSSMPRLHLQSAAFRAIETGRYMLRASNSGISAIIDPHGTITKKTTLFKREYISGTLKTMEEKTLYSRLGNWILFFAIIILLVPLLQFIVEKKPEQNP